jgi:hypothetical protein
MNTILSIVFLVVVIGIVVWSYFRRRNARGGQQVGPHTFAIGPNGDILIYGHGRLPISVYVNQVLAIEKSIRTLMRFIYNEQDTLKWRMNDKEKARALN